MLSQLQRGDEPALLPCRRSGFLRRPYIDDGDGKPGFYARNKDTIVVGTVTAVIGAIVGSVLTKALEPSRLIDKTPSSTTKSIDRGR
jgi:hypothetical protein